MINVRDARAYLIKGKGKSLKSGGMWVYDNEIDRIEGDFEDGDIIELHDFDDYFMGYGYINSNSKIRIRMLSRWREDVPSLELLEKRIRNAWNYRKSVTDTSSCRLIFGEADWLPGIVIDKFSDVLVVESLTLGIDKMKQEIVELTKRILSEDGINIRGVYERSDARVRLKEGMELYKGFIGEPFDTNVLIEENGVKYMVDVADGQKTGFFLDQKYNREAIKRLCKGKTVLDCFTHTGTFALNAAIAGARKVTAVDISEQAIAQGRINAQLNGLSDKVEFLCEDVFSLLTRYAESGERFDVVILDPPAFTKSKDTVKQAVKGYRDINMRGLKIVKDGGFLATCSCSHFFTEELMTKTIREAAAGAGHRRLRQVEFRQQAPDHPVLWAADESYYLKFFIFQVCDEL